jgi:hypothetical protein
VRVYSLSYPACNVDAPFYIVIFGLSGSVPHFSTLSHTRHDFGKKKKVMEHKKVCFFNFICKFLLKQFSFLEELSEI